jgi:flagellar biosynthesis chaperone FliJ
MKSLYLLIKIQKKNLEEIISKKKLLENKKEEKTLEIFNRKTELQNEFSKHTNSEYAVYLENFKKTTDKICNKLALEIININPQIEILDDKIREVFSEIKKFEIIIANRKKEAIKKENAEEMKMLDECALLIRGVSPNHF